MGKRCQQLRVLNITAVQRQELVVTLLEESDMGVIQCESAEAAVQELEKIGECVSMVFTDVNLAGRVDGVELAHFSKQHYPNIHVVVTSGLALKRTLPDDATFLPKPWFLAGPAA